MTTPTRYIARRSKEMRRLWVVAATVCITAALGCASQPEEPELLVFAAASLIDALTEAEPDFTAKTGITLAVSYGGSQTLARQIEAGAPADVFIAAGEPPMDTLEQAGLVEPGWSGILSNQLVVATGAAAPQIASLEDLAGDAVGRVAVADPRTAPAGSYAKDALDRLGLWQSLEDKLLIGSDVRATLAYVQSGNADAALVYRTDAAAAGLLALDIVPLDSYSPIVYPAAVVSSSQQPTAAREFVAYLRGDEARRIFASKGFKPLAK